MLTWGIIPYLMGEKSFSILNSLFLQGMIICLSLLLPGCASHKKITSPSGGKNMEHKQYVTEEERSSYYDASKQKILGNYTDAIDLYRKCLSLDPANGAADYEIANIMEQRRQPDSAVYYLNRAITIDPANKWYSLLLAQCLHETGKYKEEAQVYEMIIKRFPFDPENYNKLALAQLQEGDYKAATETYNELEKKRGTFDEDISMNKIQIYEKTKEYDKAEKEIDKLIAHDKDNPQYLDMLGNLYQIEGKSEMAVEEYKSVEQKSPDDPMVHLSLADYYREHLHDNKKAEEELIAAFELSSLDVNTEITIIRNILQLSNGHDTLSDMALKLSAIMIKSHPAEPEAHVVYGELLYSINEPARARGEYKKAVGEDSSNYAVWEVLIRMDNQLADYKAMEEDSKGALSIFPDHPAPYLYYGIAETQLKKYDAAVNVLSRGLQYALNDNNELEQMYTFIGDAANNAKRYTTSDSAYEQALKLNPQGDYVMNNYSYFLSLRDTNLARAEELSKKSNELKPGNDSYEDTYCWVLYQEGKYADARIWEDKALKDGGAKDATVLEHYGDILFRLNDKEGALEYWQKAKQAGTNTELLDRKIKDKQLYDK